MRPLVIDSDSLERLAALKKYAEENVFSMDDLLDRFNEKAAPIGNEENFKCEIPVGFRVCFSMEEAPHLCRHLSVSVDAEDKFPHVIAVVEIMKHLGFSNDLKNCSIKVNDRTGDVPANIEVIEIVKKAF